METIKFIVRKVHIRSEKVMTLTLYIVSTLVCFSGLLYLCEKLFGREKYLAQYTHLTSFYRILEISLIVLIFSKVHKILDDYILDNKIRVLDLVEISITTLLLEMVFHSGFTVSSQMVVFLTLLMVFFVVLSVLQKKGLIQSESSEHIVNLE